MFEIDPVTRRRFIHALAAAGTLAAVSSSVRTAQAEAPAGGAPALPPTPHREPTKPLKVGNERILILIYPGFTELDALGPKYALGGMTGAKVELVAKTAAPLRCESGFDVTPNVTFETCVQKPDLLVVPGGMMGTLAAIEDPQTLQFVKKIGAAAGMVGSVCTGSLVLGAAGLLDGYEATCHWGALELLPLFGAKPSTARVVFDRNRVTGAGVTAGLDFGFELVRRYRDDFYTKGLQLLAQYDPQPPFPGGGDPKTADPAAVALLTEMHKPFIELATMTIQKVRPTQKKP